MGLEGEGLPSPDYGDSSLVYEIFDDPSLDVLDERGLILDALSVELEHFAAELVRRDSRTTTTQLGVFLIERCCHDVHT